MTTSPLASWLPAAWTLLVPLAASIPLGIALARVLDVPASREARGLDAVPMFLRRLIGRRVVAGSTWRRYAVDMLGFNAAAFAVGFVLLSLQQYLPLNPDGKASLGVLGVLGSDTGVVFNTAVSFATNCSLQHYAGEQHLSYFSQLGAITWLDLVSAAAGLGCLLAVARGLRGDADLGNFYDDLIRSLALVLVPLCVAVAAGLRRRLVRRVVAPIPALRRHSRRPASRQTIRWRRRMRTASVESRVSICSTTAAYGFSHRGSCTAWSSSIGRWRRTTGREPRTRLRCGASPGLRLD